MVCALPDEAAVDVTVQSLEGKVCAEFQYNHDFAETRLTRTHNDYINNLEDEIPRTSLFPIFNGTITVSEHCNLDICNEIYYDGRCQSFRHGSYTPLSSSLSFHKILSTSCICYQVA